MLPVDIAESGFEPRAGGRVFDRGVDSSECQWGRVSAYEPPTRYAFKVTSGPARPVGEYRFTTSGNATEVTFMLRAQLSGVKKVVMSKPVQDSMTGEMAALDTAKAVIESV